MPTLLGYNALLTLDIDGKPFDASHLLKVSGRSNVAIDPDDLARAIEVEREVRARLKDRMQELQHQPQAFPSVMAPQGKSIESRRSKHEGLGSRVTITVNGRKADIYALRAGMRIVGTEYRRSDRGLVLHASDR